jgi:hypothetical protein
MKHSGLAFSDNFFSILGFYRCPKTKAARDKKYLAWIRTLPCAVCGKPGPSEAAHQRILQGGGIGLKPSDYESIPLCTDCHHIEHAVGSLCLWNYHSGLKFTDKTELRDHIKAECRTLVKSYHNQKGEL